MEPPYIRQEQARAKERSLYLETLKKESNRQETNTDEFTPIDAGIEQSTANREWARLNENDEMQAQELYVFQTSLGTSRLKEEVDRFGNCFFLSLARQWLLSQERPPSNTPYIPDADLYKTTAFSISDQVLDYMLAHRSDFEDSFANRQKEAGEAYQTGQPDALDSATVLPFCPPVGNVMKSPAEKSWTSVFGRHTVASGAVRDASEASSTP